MNRVIFTFFTLLKICCTVTGQTLYVDGVKGNDENKGTSTLPLKSLEKAVFMAKNTSGHEALTIKIAPGLYMRL
jgi:hypothetical protein